MNLILGLRIGIHQKGSDKEVEIEFGERRMRDTKSVRPEESHSFDENGVPKRWLTMDLILQEGDCSKRMLLF